MQLLPEGSTGAIVVGTCCIGPIPNAAIGAGLVLSGAIGATGAMTPATANAVTTPPRDFPAL